MDRLAELHDLAQVQPLRDDDVRAAVEDLGRSTHAMNKQAETLRHQRDALSRLVANRADTQARRRELEASRQQKFESERVRISSEVIVEPTLFPNPCARETVCLWCLGLASLSRPIDVCLGR